MAVMEAGWEEETMTTQEIEVYRKIQRNAEMGMKAIDAVSDKVYDDALAMQLSRQTLKYSEIHNAAAKQLVAGKAEYYRSGFLEDAKLRTGLHYNTLLNTSTGHIAELMIKSSTNGILDMEKALKRNENIGEKTATLAKRLIECEERNVARLKQYL